MTEKPVWTGTSTMRGGGPWAASGYLLLIFVLAIGAGAAGYYWSKPDPLADKRPMPRPYVVIGNPTIPECSVRVSKAAVPELIQIGIADWAKACEAARGASSAP